MNMKMVYDLFEAFTYWMWGPPLLTLILVTGVWITLRTRFFQLTHLGRILKDPFRKMCRETAEFGKGGISSFQAVCTAIGASVGVSNISGVGTAIATGGPGALFWLWVAGLLAMMVKFAEVSLACYYRKTMPDGSHRGGPTYYMQYGLGEERGWHKILWKGLSLVFGCGIFCTFFITLTNYTVAEAIGSTFRISYLIPGIILMIATWIITFGGLKKTAAFASCIVPFMCAFYVVAVLIVLVMNAERILPSIRMILQGAFTSQAAAGGFLGASVKTAMSTGFARSVYSNEAGWGTSAMVHATAECEHPCRQGMMGAFEVFVDTMVVCTATGLAVIVTGFWNSGLTGAELTLCCLEANLGVVARVILAIAIFLFGLTTATGWYSYYLCLLQHLCNGRLSKKAERVIFLIYKLTMPIFPFLLTVITVFTGGTPAGLWVLADFSSVVPTFTNVFALLCLSGTFFSLFRDYQARYFGKGAVDPSFAVFYEDQCKTNAKGNESCGI